MTKILYILGAGGHGKVVADAAKKMKQWEEIYFLDDKLIGEIVLGLLVKDTMGNAEKYKESNAEFIVAIGLNSLRKEIQEKLTEKKCNIATIIHPFTSISENTSIGQGTVILSGALINASTSIGEGSILNTGCSIDHDSLINNYVHISPGAKIAGFVKIGSFSWIGINATIINGVNITSNCIIGANSLVIKSIHTEGRYIGSPVRRLE